MCFPPLLRTCGRVERRSSRDEWWGGWWGVTWGVDGGCEWMGRRRRSERTGIDKLRVRWPAFIQFIQR